MNIVMDMSSYEIEPSSSKEAPAATMARFDAQAQLAPRLQTTIPERASLPASPATADVECFLHRMARQGGAS